MNVDVIFATSSTEVESARRATKTILNASLGIAGTATRVGLGERAEAKQVEQQPETKIVRREKYDQR